MTAKKPPTARSGKPNGRILPPTETLLEWRAQGLTYQQIADLITKQTGHPVSKSTVAADLSRHGHTVKPTPRYDDEVPWAVRVEHQNDYAVRMLRLYGRVRANGPTALKDDEQGRLTRWLEQLDEMGIIVAYNPTQGFLYVPADEVDDQPHGIPIRPRLIDDDEIP